MGDPRKLAEDAVEFWGEKAQAEALGDFDPVVLARALLSALASLENATEALKEACLHQGLPALAALDAQLGAQGDESARSDG